MFYSDEENTLYSKAAAAVAATKKTVDEFNTEGGRKRRWVSGVGGRRRKLKEGD